MNYRHAYHAGNFADCLKHAILVWLIQALQRKPTPFQVLDTHAGAGFYDLQGKAARKTNEAASGFLRLQESPPVALLPYLEAVCRTGLYPGSPALVRALLRDNDRLVACDLHPEEHAQLRARMSGDARVAVHLRDGYGAVRAFLPPPERRGLTLIDPPFEREDEFGRLAAAIREAGTRFPGGVAAGWYPVKHLAPVREFHATLKGLRDIVAVEFHLREPLDPARLNGCGLVVVNPPFRFESAASDIARALLSRLGTGEKGAMAEVRRLADE